MRTFSSVTIDQDLHAMNTYRLSLAVDVGLVVLNVLEKEDVLLILENAKIHTSAGYKMKMVIDKLEKKVVES